MSFDAIARRYHAVETLAFGGVLQRARVAWLGEVTHARRALIIGEGDGRFLAELLAAASTVEVDCVDGSAAMLALAANRVHASPRVRFHHADAMAELPGGPYDLIVTHFVLDCFDHAALTSLVAALVARLAPGGRWLLADFRVPHGAVRGAHARVLLAIMYRFFGIAARLRVQRLVDPTPLLCAHGLVRTHWHELHAGMIGTAVWTAP